MGFQRVMSTEEDLFPEPEVPMESLPASPIAPGENFAPPQERSNIPMLTNIPESARKASAEGNDVYFLSDRPETEQFLARERPEFKSVMRDLQPSAGAGRQNMVQAWNDFKDTHLISKLGYDPDKVNPGAAGKAARDKYLEETIGGFSAQDVGEWDPKYLKSVYAEADKVAKQAFNEELSRAKIGQQMRAMFVKDFSAQQTRAGQKTTMKPVVEPGSGKSIYMPEEMAAGMEVPGGRTGAIKAQHPESKETRWYYPERKEWGPAVGAEPRQPNFKEEKLKEIWDRLDPDSQLHALGAFPPDKEITEKNIMDLWGNIFTDAETKKALQPIVNEITKRAAEKNKNPNPGGKNTYLLPEGSKQIGTYQGKPVYQTPDGRRLVTR